jgi:hypothetical protein
VAYEETLHELYQVPVDRFVEERKRLAGELKTAGDAAGAKRLLARKRPPVSAWVVNQLYWHARDAFDEMLATAEQLRKGHLKASSAHRDAIAKLRKRAFAILEDAGHAATEATLRRVTTTLSALAASGSWQPDLPGTLAADLDPPGFEALGISSVASDDDDGDEPVATPRDGKAELANARAAHGKQQDDHAEQHRRAEMEEKRRAEEERKRKRAERHELEAALRSAKVELSDRERAVKQLDKQLDKAQKDVAAARETVEDIESKIAALDES